MRADRLNGRRIITPRSQRGVVLLIALIILVAMTLAAIGMIRSVDTGSVVAGNLAFKQATAHANDTGASAAFNALAAVANSLNAADKTILNFTNGQPCPPGVTAAGPSSVPAGFAGCTGPIIDFPGYSSTPLLACEVTRTCLLATDYTWWMVDANWANAPTVPVVDPTNGARIATYSYLIHRMCQVPNEVPTYIPQAVPGGTQLCQSAPDNCGNAMCGRYVYYRVTMRSVGARNTVTYAQMQVNISMSEN